MITIRPTVNMRGAALRSAGLLFIVLTVAACSTAERTIDSSHHSKTAKAMLQPTTGNSTKGEIKFTEVKNGVRVTGEVSGLAPGKHGFHVHENGDCSSGDGKSAGGHFNPGGSKHGGPQSEQKHAGDMGNIEADQNGVASIDKVFPFLSLEGDNSIVGRGLIVHADADDLHSQPTGNAGARLACAVIEK